MDSGYGNNLSNDAPMGLNKILNFNSDSDACGVGPFQLPSWFPFEEACAEHDAAYLFWREEFLRHHMDVESESVLRKKMELWGIRIKLALADKEFEADISRDIDTHGGVRRLIYKAIAKGFNTLVSSFGYPIWCTNTVTEWKNRRGV